VCRMLIISNFCLTDHVGGRTVGQMLKAASGSDTWDLGGQWVGR